MKSEYEIMRKEFCIFHEDRVEKHYAHAREKHPYFADILLDHIDAPERWAWLLALERRHLQLDTASRTVRPLDVLKCEVAEVMAALARGDTAQAVEECYDTIAVLLRTIDVLEGRQTLGKPKKEGAAK